MKTIAELRAEQEKDYAEKRSKLEQHETLFDAALKALAKLNIVSVYFTGTLDVGVTGDRHALMAAFGALRRLNFTPSSRPVAGSPSYSAFFTHDSGAMVWFSFSSTQCRRVKVGTKTVEQDVYETVCDEMQLPDAITKAEPATEMAEDVPF
jgi:hypothetical protein